MTLETPIILIDNGSDGPILNALLGISGHSDGGLSKIKIYTDQSARFTQIKNRFSFYTSIEIKLCSKDELSKLKSSPVIKASHSDSPFLIVSAANDAFRWWYNQLSFSTSKFNYPIEIYDLGDLGFGHSYKPSILLNEHGYYTVIDEKWKSKALHKPDIIADCLARNTINTVYLDADTYIFQPIGEIFDPEFGEYDVGVTIRSPREIEKNAAKQNHKYTGYINAGVVFFRPTEGAKKFVKRWQELTLEVKNDQVALNLLVNPQNNVLVAGEEISTTDFKIKFFDGGIYNYDYQIDDEIKSTEKIFHFKNAKDRLLHFEEYLSDLKNNSLLDLLILKISPETESYDNLMLQIQTLRNDSRRVRANAVHQRLHWRKQKEQFHLIKEEFNSLMEKLKKNLFKEF